MCKNVNITVPVFNRVKETFYCLTSIRKNTIANYTLNVVDNGSDQDTIEMLHTLYKNKVIDNLVFLGKNYGVSCARNTGIRLVSADLYITIDNDIIIEKRNWLGEILKLWNCLPSTSVLGHWYKSGIGRGENTEEIQTGEYKLYKNARVLPGMCIFLPRFVLENIGYFCEDYGIYGEEDTDYSFRLAAAGIPMHAIDMNNFLHEQPYNNVYNTRKISKSKLAVINRGKAQRPGLLMCNRFMYDFCLKRLNVPLRYSAKRISEHEVRITENEEYKIYKKKFLQCKIALTRHLGGRGIHDINELVLWMKETMKNFC